MHGNKLSPVLYAVLPHDVNMHTESGYVHKTRSERARYVPEQSVTHPYVMIIIDGKFSKFYVCKKKVHSTLIVP